MTDVALPPLPDRLAARPRDERGYPVPFFVAWVDGKPDFRVVDPERKRQAFQHELCWICGQKLGAYRAFLIGPMCAVNRLSAEPPAHRDCAEFSAAACPFLTRPQQKRNEVALPEGHALPPGEMIKRNPGVVLLWVVKGASGYRVLPDGLVRLGAPSDTVWYREGREATRQEVLAAFDSGLPLLQKIAAEEGAEAEEMLQAGLEDAKKYLPEAA